ncbi:hypothetical protein DC498_09285 [Terrimonas sp.]|uniref:hypothetical protein n=1 Tax=Terrimonas sp. TaxID=1914338 RepID=UPI000D51FBB4|nr:hypothetical protein [Terrimonas sp.]PVD52692.1 hypothetical protein DC498_09285 [Terrimonas sp.]
MKFAFFTAFLAILVKTGPAQSFTIPELIDLENNDIDFFDSKVIQKGYLLSKSNNDEVRYTLKDNLAMLNSIAIAYYPNVVDSSLRDRCIWWIFNSESNYIKIKSELKSEGFAIVNDLAEKDGKGHRFIYARKENEKVVSIHLVIRNSEIYKYPIYNLLVYNK